MDNYCEAFDRYDNDERSGPREPSCGVRVIEGVDAEYTVKWAECRFCYKLNLEPRNYCTWCGRRQKFKESQPHIAQQAHHAASAS